MHRALTEMRRSPLGGAAVAHRFPDGGDRDRSRCRRHSPRRMRRMVVTVRPRSAARWLHGRGSRRISGSAPTGHAIRLARPRTFAGQVLEGNDLTQPARASSADAGLRPDVIAGLTAAAVVLPKAMAYATVAGLPVSVGLYTAFVPMIVYALLGTSRVLSVSSTTTLAILVAAQLGAGRSGRRPRPADHGDGDAHGPDGRAPDRRFGASTGVRRELHLGAGPDRLQGRDRAGHRARSGAEAPRHPYHQGGLLPRRPEPRAASSGCLHRHARHRGRGPGPAADHGADLATFARAASGGGRRHRRVLARRPRRSRRRDGGPHSPGAALDHAAGPRSGHAAIARGDRHRPDELYRDDRRGPRVRSSVRAADQSRPGASGHGRRQPGGRVLRRDAGRRRNVADGGRPCSRRADAEGVARHRGGLGRDDAGSGAAARPPAAGGARGHRDRLLDRPDPAARVRGDPQGPHHGVPLGARGLPRRARVRHLAGHPRRHRPVTVGALQPGGASAGPRDRPQAGRGRPAPAVARASRTTKPSKVS